MMEEWRAVVVDSVVMSLVNGREIEKNHFMHDQDSFGYYLNKDGIKIFITKLGRKLDTEIKYLSYIDYSVTFRRAMELQLNELVKDMEQEDDTIYKPLWIR